MPITQKTLQQFLCHAAAILLLAFVMIALARWLHPATFSFNTEITILTTAIAALTISIVLESE